MMYGVQVHACDTSYLIRFLNQRNADCISSYNSNATFLRLRYLPHRANSKSHRQCHHLLPVANCFELEDLCLSHADANGNRHDDDEGDDDVDEWATEYIALLGNALSFIRSFILSSPFPRFY